MALPQREYGDPLEVLLRREAGKCDGCEEYVEKQGRIMKHARKQDLDSFVERSPFNKVMDIWTRWLALSDRPNPDGDSNLQDTKDFMRAGEAAEVMINDLPRYQWWAIRKSRGISTVWLFPTLNLLDALDDAEKILTPKMQQHIATRRFFD